MNASAGVQVTGLPSPLETGGTAGNRWIGVAGGVAVVSGLRHRLNPLLALARLSTSIRGVATGVTVTGVTTRRGRISEVASSVGSLMPGVVIFATGAPPALPGLDLDLPGRLIKGHLLVTEAAPVALPSAVAPVATPLENGRLLVGGALDLNDPTPEVDGDVIASIRAGLRDFLPATADLAVTHAWCCFRPAHPDGLPVVEKNGWSLKRLGDLRPLPHWDPDGTHHRRATRHLDQQRSGATRGGATPERAPLISLKHSTRIRGFADPGFGHSLDHTVEGRDMGDLERTADANLVGRVCG
jgi:hypothetical protein